MSRNALKRLRRKARDVGEDEDEDDGVNEHAEPPAALTVEVEVDDVTTAVEELKVAELKHEVNTEVKHEVKTEVNTEVKNEVKHEVKTEVKHEVKTEVKPVVALPHESNGAFEKILLMPGRISKIASMATRI